jgi:protein-disulfide isomerase
MRNLWINLTILSCVLSISASSQVTGDVCSALDLPVAEIDGSKFSLADVERKRSSDLFQARNTLYEAQRKAVQEFIDEHLLEKQALKEKVTVAELLQRHVDSKIAADPPDESLRVYYEGLDTAESFEAVRDKILGHLRQRRIAKAKTAYMQSLRAQADIRMQLAPPKAEVSLKDTPVRGPADAPVVVVEFADYECPYCQQIQPALDRLEADYKGKIAFAYKDVPLPMHSKAQKAAEAAHCAGVQGKYWEYHDLILVSKKLDLPSLRDQARELKLNGAEFDRCLDSGQKAGIVSAHVAEAQALGLQGTPSLFINGRFFSGLLSYEQMRSAVEEELSRLSGGPQSAAIR